MALFVDLREHKGPLMSILPTLRQLQFFVALARRQSFSRAAQDCLVSQSTLSSAIKELEAILEVQLVDRSTRAFLLTPVGERVVKQAAALLSSSEDLVLSVRDRTILSDDFRLGVIPTIAPFLIPSLAPALKHAYPDSRLFLREDLTSTLIEQLSLGLLDAALLALPFEMPGLDTIDVGTDKFWFACAQSHPFADKKTITPAQLAKIDLLLLEDGHCLRDHALAACHLRTDENSGSFGATSLLTLAQMTRAGLGATLLPDMAVRQGMVQAADLTAIPLEGPAQNRTIGIAWRRGSGRADDARALAETARESLAKLQEHPYVVR